MKAKKSFVTFHHKLEAIIKKHDSLLCIGLDTDIEKIPQHLLKAKDPIFEFNKQIIDNTCDLICCYKANIAYYSANGTKGLDSLIKTVDYIHSKNIPFILDAKRADIGSTSDQYVKEVFDEIGADAVTVNPYLGLDGIEPFLKRKDKGIIILCRTSNQGAKDFQDLEIDNEPLYLRVAKKIIEWDKTYGNCLMVVGATWPEELGKIRKLAPEMFFLVPGVGSQGGDLENTLKFGLTKKKSGLIIHSARAIIYASNAKDFAPKAREKAFEACDIINQYRNGNS